ncbi:hypothetical protein THAOC_31208, partial [Thalassiosira oceanica]
MRVKSPSLVRYKKYPETALLQSKQYLSQNLRTSGGGSLRAAAAFKDIGSAPQIP